MTPRHDRTSHVNGADADDGDLDVVAGVGSRLREVRRARRMTLADLAARTGLSASTLSRLENGRMRPTLEQLLPLARVHRVPLDDLVGAPATGDPRVHLKPLRRRGITFVPLTRRPGGLQAFKAIYPPAVRAGRQTLQTHEGYEWFYVLDGRVRLVLGDQDLILDPGEAAEFDARTPHWLWSADDRPAELLILVGVHGERAHVAAPTPPTPPGRPAPEDPPTHRA